MLLHLHDAGGDSGGGDAGSLSVAKSKRLAALKKDCVAGLACRSTHELTERVFSEGMDVPQFEPGAAGVPRVRPPQPLRRQAHGVAGTNDAGCRVRHTLYRLLHGESKTFHNLHHAANRIRHVNAKNGQRSSDSKHHGANGDGQAA
jgi:hypothetical protein